MECGGWQSLALATAHLRQRAQVTEAFQNIYDASTAGLLRLAVDLAVLLCVGVNVLVIACAAWDEARALKLCSAAPAVACGRLIQLHFVKVAQARAEKRESRARVVCLADIKFLHRLEYLRIARLATLQALLLATAAVRAGPPPSAAPGNALSLAVGHARSLSGVIMRVDTAAEGKLANSSDELLLLQLLRRQPQEMEKEQSAQAGNGDRAASEIAVGGSLAATGHLCSREGAYEADCLLYEGEQLLLAGAQSLALLQPNDTSAGTSDAAAGVSFLLPAARQLPLEVEAAATLDGSQESKDHLDSAAASTPKAAAALRRNASARSSPSTRVRCHQRMHDPQSPDSASSRCKRRCSHWLQ